MDPSQCVSCITDPQNVLDGFVCRPLRSVEFNGFGVMPAWFDVASLDKSSQTQKVDEAGMLASAALGNHLS